MIKHVVRLLMLTVALSVMTFGGHGEEISKQGNRDMLIIAHRGGSSLGNENTLSCIAAGVASGADMVEIDVHQTSDGHIVVCHDSKVDRTTDGKGRISDLTLDDIRSFRIVGSDGKLTEECIPTLEEVLEIVDGRCGILLEIKRKRRQYEGIEARVLEILRKYDALDYTVIQSFNDRVIEQVHELAPSVRVEKLMICRIPGLPLVFDGGITGFSWEKYDYVSSFNVYRPCLHRSFLNKLHAHGKEAKVWTVNREKDFPEIPVDGIITDRPLEFLQMAGRR